MPRRNPLHPDHWLPTTGNPAIDGAARATLGRLAGAAYEQMGPNAQALVGSLWSALEYAPEAGAMQANPDTAAPEDDKVRFVADLLGLESARIVVLGRQGSGKTALCLKLAQEYQERQRRPVFVVGMPQRVLTGFGFQEIAPLELLTVPKRSVVVVDDAALFFNNRSYGSDESAALRQFMIEIRHVDLIFILNAHQSALLDKYALAPTVLFLKPSSAMTDDLQRSGLRGVVKRADAAFAALPAGAEKARVYAVSDELHFEGMLTTVPPRGWSQAVSKHHAATRRGRRAT